MDREPSEPQSMWSQRVGHDLVIKQQHITPTFKLTFWLQSQDFNKWCIQAFPAQGC